jgi:hypothetical protein
MRGQALLAAGVMAMAVGLGSPAHAQPYQAPPGAAYQDPACQQRKTGNTVLGALLGGVVGAALGNNIAGRGHHGDGSVLGGVLGAGAGAAIGNSGTKCYYQGPPPPPVAPQPPTAQGPYGPGPYAQDDDEILGGPNDRNAPPPRYAEREAPPPRYAYRDHPRQCRWGDAIYHDRWGRPYHDSVYMCRDPYSGEWVIQR